MRIYTVGGDVRDELLGLPRKDRDHVVVGATPEGMRALGFRQVGRDFPVFLHPETHEEYALARTERKTGHGYTGFAVHAAPEVSLEDDLARRDLTINAMAKDEAGTLIDPYGGASDLRARILRHVGPAFVEDPVRILRLARFAARFPDFSVAPETMTLARRMVDEGEVDHLVPERVWQELARGLMEAQPSRMIAVLRECGALGRLLPEVDRLFGVPQRSDYHPEVDTGLHTLMTLDAAARQESALPVRFAALCHDLGKANTPAAEWPRHHGHEERGFDLAEALCARLKLPGECRDLALLTVRYHGKIHRAAELRPATLVSLLEETDALRRPQRFEQLLQACRADFDGRGAAPDQESVPTYDAPPVLLCALAAMRNVDAAAIVRACADPSHIPARLHEARAKAVRTALSIEFPQLFLARPQ
ncbi:MAG: multifunctional CCA addition/repair protein [Betaproteobacteria bacterium]|nr:multifunctional CCA addition/repair protein [Betaproteobacteria bacterium]